jgi:hypothetical protein
MKTQVILIAILVLLTALMMPFLLGIVGAIAGLAFAFMIAIGALLLVGFIVAVVLSGPALIVGAILGIVGVVLLALALPLLAPLFLVLLPIILLIKLIS